MKHGLMMTCLAFVGTALLAGCVTFPGTQPAAPAAPQLTLYQRLDVIDAQVGRGETGFNVVAVYLKSRPLTVSDLGQVLEFLHGKSVTAAAADPAVAALSDPRYHLLYSGTIKDVFQQVATPHPDQKDDASVKAAAIFAAGKTIIEQDIARCEDRNAGGELMSDINVQNDYVRAKILPKMTKDSKASGKALYLAMMKNVHNRTPARYACKSGTAYYAKLTSAAYRDKVTKVIIPSGNGKENIVVLDDRKANVPVGFVSDKVWRPKAEVIEKRNLMMFE